MSTSITDNFVTIIKQYIIAVINFVAWLQLDIVECNIRNSFTARNVNFAELEPIENRVHFVVTTDNANLMPRA